jgi:CheY-like chemotaxis protein
MARRVLLVGGDAQILAELGEYLDHRDSEVESVGYCDDALILLRRRQLFDLVLILSLNAPWRTWSSLSSPTPRNIGSTSAIMFLKQMRVLYNQVPVIVVSGNLRRRLFLPSNKPPWPLAEVAGAEFRNGSPVLTHASASSSARCSCP